MDFYVYATFAGANGNFGYDNGEQYELSLHLDQGVIKIYECPSGQDWDFPDFYSFLQNWSNVTFKD